MRDKERCDGKSDRDPSSPFSDSIGHKQANQGASDKFVALGPSI